MADIPRQQQTDYAGRSLGRYNVLEIIERTPLSASYRALDGDTGRVFFLTALNCELPMPAERRQRFRQECSLVARLNHPAIPRLVSYYADEELPFLVFEDHEGQLLSERLGKPWPHEIATPLVDDLAAALDAAHRGGVIHQTFGPGRVVMRSDERPLIRHFALPRVLGVESQVGTGPATLAPVEYLSPEQLRGQPADARSDVYALAVLAYEMLSGDPPFGGSPDAVARAHQQDQPRDLRRLHPGASPWVTDAIMRGLEKDPRDRFQGMKQFADALRRHEALAAPPADSEPLPSSRRSPVFQDLGGPVKRSPRVGGAAPLLAIVVLLAAIAVGAFLLLGGDDDSDNAGGLASDVVATSTSAPEATPTATPAGQAGLAVGDIATVQNTEAGLNLRLEPAGDQIGSLPNGTSVTITGGPVVQPLTAGQEELTWWEVDSEFGSGWVAEGSGGVLWLSETGA
jgi:serine/threonine protein kinase